MSLEELKLQRAQIQQHLEWLDAKITEFTPEVSELPAKETTELPATSDTTASPNSEAQIKTEPATSIPSTETPSDSLDIETSYQPKTQNDILRARIGCIAIFVIAVSLFLFLLFGLPYLI